MKFTTTLAVCILAIVLYSGSTDALWGWGLNRRLALGGWGLGGWGLGGWGLGYYNPYYYSSWYWRRSSDNRK